MGGWGREPTGGQPGTLSRRAGCPLGSRHQGRPRGPRYCPCEPTHPPRPAAASSYSYPASQCRCGRHCQVLGPAAVGRALRRRRPRPRPRPPLRRLGAAHLSEAARHHLAGATPARRAGRLGRGSRVLWDCRCACCVGLAGAAIRLCTPRQCMPDRSPAPRPMVALPAGSQLLVSLTGGHHFIYDPLRPNIGPTRWFGGHTGACAPGRCGPRHTSARGPLWPALSLPPLAVQPPPPLTSTPTN